MVPIADWFLRNGHHYCFCLDQFVDLSHTVSASVYIPPLSTLSIISVLVLTSVYTIVYDVIGMPTDSGASQESSTDVNDVVTISPVGLAGGDAFFTSIKASIVPSSLVAEQV